MAKPAAKSAAPHAPTPDETAAEARRAGFALSPEQAGGLARYLTLLLKWNRAMNLVGRADWPGVFRDLAADSLHLAGFLAGLPLPGEPLTLDLGAGAGLPGIPLRLVWPRGDYVLVELREKRAIFLAQTIAALGLARTYALRGRAEESLASLPNLGGLAGLTGLAGLGQAGERRADLVLSRAFMPWPKLLPLAGELLRPGGALVVLANEAPPEGLCAPGAGFWLAASRDYPSEARRRYFWALVRA